MTVAELVEALSHADPDTPVRIRTTTVGDAWDDPDPGEPIGTLYVTDHRALIIPASLDLR